MPKRWAASLTFGLLFVACQNSFAAPMGEGEPSYHGKTLKQWIELSRDDDAKVRLCAVVHLGLGPFNKAAVPALRVALSDSNSEVRPAAVAALGEIGRDAQDSADDLAALLKKGLDLKECEEICETLSRIGPAAVPGLVKALAIEDTQVQREAANAIAKIGPDAKAGVPALIKVLQQNRDARWAVIDALQGIGPDAKAAVPAILAAVKEDDVLLIVGSASDALAAIGEPPVPALIELLRDPNAKHRSFAAKALGRIGPKADKAVPALIELLNDPEKNIRPEAAEALGRIGPAAKAAIPRLIDSLSEDEVDKRAAEALARIGEAAIPALAKALQAEDGPATAGLALGLMGKPGLPTLRKAFDHDDAYVRGHAIRALDLILREANEAARHIQKEREWREHPIITQSGVYAGWSWHAGPESAARALEVVRVLAPQALPSLVKVLKDDDVRVRRSAASALESYAQEGAILLPALAAAANDEDADVRESAVLTAGRIRPVTKESVRIVGAALGDPEREVRRTAAYSLKRMGPGARAAVSDLAKGLADEDILVRSDVAEALARIGPHAKDAVPALVDAIGDEDSWFIETRFPRAVIRALGQIGPDAKMATVRLKAVLGCKYPELRIAAAAALGRLDPGNEEMLGMLIEFRAAQELGEIGPKAKAAVPILIKQLGAEDFSTRRDAVFALGRIGPEAKDAVPALRRGLGEWRDIRDPHPWGRLTIYGEALALIGPAAVPELRKALQDPDFQVRWDACCALGRMGKPAKTAAPDIAELLYDSNPYTRVDAARALAVFGPDSKVALPALVEGLRDRSPDVRQQAAITLCAIGPEPKAVFALGEALKDREPAVRREAASALGRLGTSAKDATLALAEACKDAEGITRVRAAAALVKVGGDKVEALPVLKAALKDKDPAVRVAAAGALWEVDLSKDALLVLVSALEDNDDEVCCDAAAMLGKIGPGAKAVVPDLLRLLKDKYAPYYDPAAEALKEIDAEAAKKAGVR